jgi:DNA repair protein RecO
MSHHIYTTDAFIIESNLLGEADRYYTLFTRDLGLIRATARGVRLQKSKLKYSLQDFSRSSVSLVRGKDIWRLTSAKLEDSLYVRYKNDTLVLTVVAQIMALMKRLVGTEEKNEALYMILSDAFIFLESCIWNATEESIAELKNFEIIVVLKILHNLGYMASVKELAPFIDEQLSQHVLHAMHEHKKAALKEINNSLRETQL